MKIDNNNITDKVNQYFAFVFTLFSTIVVLVLLNGIKDELNVEFIGQYYNVSLDAFLPEKSEKLQYMIGTVSFPIFYIIYYLIFHKVKYYGNAEKIYNITLNSGFNLLFSYESDQIQQILKRFSVINDMDSYISFELVK